MSMGSVANQTEPVNHGIALYFETGFLSVRAVQL